MATDTSVGNPVMVGGGVVDGTPVKPTQIDMTNTISRRKISRAAKNPLDKCTIVSIFPWDIEPEIKPTIEPGKFKIPYGTFEKPGTLVVGGSSWQKDYDPDQPILEIPQGSIQIAESIVKDYCNSMLEFREDASPGIFFVVGEQSSLEIKTKYKEKLNEVKVRQDNWFRYLVRLADSLWSRANGNPVVIWDVMRLAARELNLNDKTWLKDTQMAELVKCFACGNMRNPNYPICPTCKVIDQNHPNAKELKFAV